MDRDDGRFSCFVSETLNCLGYKPSFIKERRQMWEELAKKRFIKFINYSYIGESILVGSKGEGISAPFQNDLDMMVVYTNTIAAEDIDEYINVEKTLFKLDRELTPPGYAKLKLFRRGDILGYQMDMLGAYIKTNSGTYVSSETMVSCINEWSRRFSPRQGPSCPYSICNTSIDFVQAIPCQCPLIMSVWLARHRKQDWPSQETIHKIVSLDAHVVPVGFKQSPDQSLEWRICYTLAELALVHSFNDVQTKVYILLKLMAKHVLKSVSGAMTSYVMKNLMFWMAEWTPLRSFCRTSLIDRLVQAFKILYKFIKVNFLPNYMIPWRNLLAGKFDAGRRRQLLSLLDELIADGGCMLFRCKNLRLRMLKMYQTPERAREDGEKRDTVERTMLVMSAVVGNDSTLPLYTILGATNMPEVLGTVLVSNKLTSEADKEMLSETLYALAEHLDLDEHVPDSDPDVIQRIIMERLLSVLS